MFKGLYKSSRSIPYSKYLIVTFPFFAVLISKGFINSIYSIFLIIPFITTMAAGFLYNTICDADKDPVEKNPVKNREVSRSSVLYCTVLLIIISFLLVILQYSSQIALISFVIYMFLWLAYSGLKIRFKETVLGPAIASIVLFVGAPFILLIEFNYFDHVTLFILFGLFIIYTGHEIKHTVIDHDIDSHYNCKTFSIIFGKKYAIIAELISLIIGFVVLLTALSYSQINLNVLILFSILFFISTITVFIHGFMYNAEKKSIIARLPYIITTVFIISYAGLILNLNPIIILFILWILFTDIY